MGRRTEVGRANLTPWRQTFDVIMEGMSIQQKRPTVYFEPHTHRALHHKTAKTERAAEPNLSFERVARDLRRRGNT